MQTNPVERRQKKEMEVSEYFHGAKRIYDPHEGCYVVKIFTGEWYVSKEGNDMLVTVLGSCISACIRDTKLHIGGMNHFLLPGIEGMQYEASAATRYGVFAMESLINGILALGGKKERLEIKVFGGGNVLNTGARIGSKNADFIRNFLHKEGYNIASEDLEGELPRRLHYYPGTGKVMMRKLHRKEDMIVVDEEQKYSKKLNTKPIEGAIDLF